MFLLDAMSKKMMIIKRFVLCSGSPWFRFLEGRSLKLWEMCFLSSKIRSLTPHSPLNVYCKRSVSLA